MGQVFNSTILTALIKPYLKDIWLDIKYAEGDYLILFYFKNEKKMEIKLSELNDQLTQGKFFDN